MRALTVFARDFNVSITRQWPGGEDVPPVKNGDAVEVLIGDDLVITGWVEALPLRYDAQTIMTGIVGRSKRQILSTVLRRLHSITGKIYS
ncbi:tail protein [Salmonella phage 118970_sal3]|uniref:tail protein n=1 Tax=Salmonella phage 118970_sal3 TaxID=1813771 RepID=UPI000865D9FD|nr:tail protein [Salmonella phage 118970_sal3]AOP04164.1 tail protein [Salmonella phage 118970_sal3]